MKETRSFKWLAQMVLAMPHAPGLLSWKTKKSAKGSK
jgi:hypothetical protein